MGWKLQIDVPELQVALPLSQQPAEQSTGQHGHGRLQNPAAVEFGAPVVGHGCFSHLEILYYHQVFVAKRKLFTSVNTKRVSQPLYATSETVSKKE